ncbi:hypothetical protein EYF80_057156 [Liparis tanakae]|uniref:Uncharacterized protein n=1 Tax=Liparis tanakae TaxID=230148 RepID=A0A4Z2EVV1_9TELE|nr:hypothetical protein EYF80_057156 [Liparis tanakae]
MPLARHRVTETPIASAYPAIRFTLIFMKKGEAEEDGEEEAAAASSQDSLWSRGQRNRSKALKLSGRRRRCQPAPAVGSG